LSNNTIPDPAEHSSEGAFLSRGTFLIMLIQCLLFGLFMKELLNNGMWETFREGSNGLKLFTNSIMTGGLVVVVAVIDILIRTFEKP